MPVQSLLRLIKRWRQYQPRGNWAAVPKQTRGIYVLYRKRSERKQEVVYIGVAGIGRNGGGGIKGRLKSHNRKKKGWTHYSIFEVHDNVSPDEIHEVETLLLGTFRHDPRIKLVNLQTCSRKLNKRKHVSVWTG